MASPIPFEPDELYCVYCHAPAAGSCASCRAIVCASCAVLSGGAVAKAAVCSQCAARGQGAVTGRAWAAVLIPVALLLGCLALAAWLVAPSGTAG